ncbi:ATP-binding cassette domain-containing protein [Nonomuraea roseoviolacea subsp. roseoviolacea]|uniref:ABC transporter ATP-binding protein n=1 Tax=Nonomuraea roseoviolacea TaxID=103837 RepID=UPI0031E3818F
MAATEPVVRVAELRKDYLYKGRAIPALHGVTFDLCPGDFVGLFGPNGAGKTTTTKIIMGLMRPKSGTVTVAGRDALKGQAAKRLMGYVPQHGSLLGTLTVFEELTFHARSFGMSAARAAARARTTADLLDVADLLNRDVQRLSGGQRRRVELAIALVHEPRILILDEPTLGLDPHTRAGLWDVLRDLRGQLGTTILMTTHYLDEASQVVDRVLIMDHGRVIATGSPVELVSRHATGTVTLGVFDRPDVLAEAIGPALRAHWDDVELNAEGRRLILRTATPETVLPAAITELLKQGVAVDEARSSFPTLSDAFFAITGRRLP